MSAEQEDLKIEESGLSLVHDGAGEEAKLDIILIHGLTGHPRKTFETPDSTNPGKTIFWPRSLLREAVPEARVLTFGYPSDFISKFAKNKSDPISQTGIEDIARLLIKRIVAWRRRDSTESRPIVFICHSLGGLVCAHALSTQDADTGSTNEVASQTIGTVFLGTPFRGSELGSYGDVLENVCRAFSQTNPRLIKDLKTNAERLTQIRTDFSSLLTRVQHIKPSFYYEAHKMKLAFPNSRLRRVFHKSVLVVDKHSAVLEQYFPYANAIYATHIGMCKFEMPSSPGFTEIIGDIRAALQKHEVRQLPQGSSGGGGNISAPYAMGDNHFSIGSHNGNNSSTVPHGVKTTITTYLGSDALTNAMNRNAAQNQ